jgi:hypothetical protein
MLGTAVDGSFEVVIETVPSSWLRAKPLRASHTRVLIERDCDGKSACIPSPVVGFGDAPAPALCTA